MNISGLSSDTLTDGKITQTRATDCFNVLAKTNGKPLFVIIEKKQKNTENLCITLHTTLLKEYLKQLRTFSCFSNFKFILYFTT